METLDLLTLWITASICTWSFLLLYYFIFLSEKRLINKGFSMEYIAFTKRDHKKRMLGISMAVPPLLLLAYAIFYLLFSIPETTADLTLILLIFILLVIPFPLMDYKKTKKSYKKLAEETGSEIAIDMKHKNLHAFYNPYLELVLNMVFIGFALFLLNIPTLAYLHLIIPWFLYLSARNAKFVTLAVLKDGYLYSFIFMLINYLIIIFYILWYNLLCAECRVYQHLIIAMGLSLLLLARAVYYIVHFRQIYRQMS